MAEGPTLMQRLEKLEADVASLTQNYQGGDWRTELTKQVVQEVHKATQAVLENQPRILSRLEAQDNSHALFMRRVNALAKAVGIALEDLL